ncbi:hypothetical protein MJO29_014365 [Puccinia striiformis f. sp. tritici]|nr:hypothetical protein MJO29_014365 [Puccinia striiformis f. sp. tritici]
MMVFLQDDVPARTAPATAAQNQKEEPADLLILGAGWTAEFLISYIEQHKKNFSYRTTTTNGGGRFDSIKFKFDPTDRRVGQGEREDSNQFAKLPNARSILISFPIKEPGGSEFLLKSYLQSRPSSTSSDSQPPSVIDVIQLGSSGIFDGGSTLNSKDSDRREDGEREAVWIDRHSAYDEKNPRAGSEDELLRLNDSRPCGPGQSGLRTTVMNLSGLWGGTRNMRNYVSKVAPTKEVLGKKTSIHMIHGLDVARAILAVLDRFALAAGQRWILTDQRVYDWWDLASAWGESGTDNRDTQVTVGPQAQWVMELMSENNVKALPRSPVQLGRALDSRQFWDTFGLSPVRARMEHYS